MMIGLLLLAGGYMMFILGNTYSNLNPLSQYWYIPLPFGLVALIVGIIRLLRRMSRHS